VATQSARESTDQNYAAQAAIGAAFLAAIAKAWPTLDLTRLSATIPTFTKLAQALVIQHARASRSVAVSHYGDLRRHAGITDTYRAPLTDLPSNQHIADTVSWGTRNLWATDGGDLPDQQQVAGQQKILAESLERLVLNTGRDQIIAATEGDRRAVAWAREERPDCCWFCAMLATRGAVYTSAEAAGKAAPAAGQMPTGLDEQGKEFVNRYHYGCRGTVVAVFNQFEPTAHVREWQALWNQTMRPDGGKPITGMAAMQRAWREAFAEWQRSNQ
jgi:hypothetical protein